MDLADELKTARVMQLREELCDLLDEIKKLFNQPCKVTLVIRPTTLANAEVIIGDDDLEKAIATIRLRQNDPTTIVIQPEEQVTE